jgi:hypothetical protein
MAHKKLRSQIRKTRRAKAPTSMPPPSFERQIEVHDAGKFEPDVERAMVMFHMLMIENARWDALRGVDPMERWRRDKEAQKAEPSP